MGSAESGERRAEITERRLELSRKFKMLTPNVYYQPPATAKLTYPCVIYELSRFHTEHGNNRLYMAKRRYTVTVIDRDPDSDIPERLLEFPLCGFDRHYCADNLHHWVFWIYW